MNQISDRFNAIIYENSVSKAFLQSGSNLATKVGIRLMPVPSSTSKSDLGKITAVATTHIMSTNLPLWRLAGLNLWIVRLAGLSGVTAIFLYAYGSDRNYDENNGESKMLFETANTYHFYHSIAMIATPLCSTPFVTGLLMALGIIFYTGPCYYRAFTGSNQYNKVAPYGGFCLLLSWLTLMI